MSGGVVQISMSTSDEAQQLATRLSSGHAKIKVEAVAN